MVVIETLCSSGREHEISAAEADSMISAYEASRFARNRYDVRRHWDAVSFSVSIHLKGETWPFLSYSTGLVD